MANFTNHPTKAIKKTSSLLFKVTKDQRDLFSNRAAEKGMTLVDYLLTLLYEDVARDEALRKKAERAAKRATATA